MTWLPELARLAAEATPAWEIDEDSYRIVAPDPEHCWLLVATVAHNSKSDRGRKNRDYIAACTPERIAALMRVAQVARSYWLQTGQRADSLSLNDAFRDLEATP